MAPPQTHTTCDDCIKIFKDAASLLSSKSGEPSLTLFHLSHRTRLAASVSASACHMCMLLGASIPRLLGPFDSREVLALAIFRARHDSDAATVGLVGRQMEALHLQTHYPGSLRIQDGEQGAKIQEHGIWINVLMVLVEHGRVSVLESPRTWSLETSNRIQSWLKSCSESHVNCAQPQIASRLPRRLIDVMSVRLDHAWPQQQIGHDDFDLLSLEKLPHVRIVSSDCLPADTPYLTLSHRWGNPPSILLTKKTLFLLSEDISPHLLNCGEAAVFRHAIHVTRSLGFRYRWIDALCIMQDDGPEKTADIMQMDDIYSNSTLNISAAEGRIREGLVFDRNILGTNPHRARIRAPNTKDDVHLQAFQNKWSLGLRESPLDQRGWVFQERTLAPRIVHFTKDQVFWECHSLEASEVLPQGVPGQQHARFGRGVVVSSTSSVQQSKSRSNELVDDYSRTSLTFADDRLRAISAVAKRFCSTLRLDPSEYLAGMWKDHLPRSLLWSQEPQPGMDGPEPSSMATEMKYAPSWSWASILWSTTSVEPTSLIATAEVLDVQIARISPNFFDGAETCRLRLRGHVCKFSRRVQDDLSWISVGQHAEFQEFSHFEFQQGRAIIISWDTARGAVADWLKASGSGPAPSTYFLLHIASERWSAEGPMERGIILRRTAVPGTYARAGSFFTPPKSEYSGSELEDAFNGRLNTLSTDDYLELDVRGKLTIDIV